MLSISFNRLPLACTLNSLYRAIPIRLANGKTVTKSVLSSRARTCKQALVSEMLRQLGGRPPRLDRECSVTISVTPRDRRTPDADAYLKQTCDALQAAGVITNDKLIVQIVTERMPSPERPGWMNVTVSELP